jgi:hypothetical protein
MINFLFLFNKIAFDCYLTTISKPVHLMLLFSR